MEICGLYVSGLVQGSVAGSCEHGKESLISIKGVELLV